MARQHEIKFKVTVDEKQLGKLKSNYSSTIKHMEKESKGLIYSFKEAVRAIQGGFFSSIGGDLKRLAGKPFKFIMDSAHEAFQSVKDLDKGIREVSTLLNDEQIARSGGLEGLKKQAKDLSLTFNKDIPDATKAMYQAISSGVSETGLKGFMDVAGKLSVGGVTSMATAVDGLTNLVNAFGESYDDVERLNQISDTLFTGMKYGKTTIDELSRSLGKGAPIAKLMGVSIEELVAASSAITTGGKTTTNSINEMKSLMTAILKPTKAAKDTMEELGISYGQTALEGKTLMEWLKDTEGKLKTAGIGWEKVFGNVRAFSGALTLTGNAAEKYDKIMKEVNDTNRKAGDISNEAFKKVGESLEERIGRVKREFTQAFMGIIEKLLPAFESLLPIFKQLAPIIENVGVALAGIFESELFKGAVSLIGDAVNALGWFIAPSKMAQKEFDALYESINKNKEALEKLDKLDIKLDVSKPEKSMEDLKNKMVEVAAVSPELAKELEAIANSSLNLSEKIDLSRKAIEDFRNLADTMTSEDRKNAVVDFFKTQQKSIEDFSSKINKMAQLYAKGFQMGGTGLDIRQGERFTELLRKSTLAPLRGKELEEFSVMAEKLRANLTKEQQIDLDRLRNGLEVIKVEFQESGDKLKELIPKEEFIKIFKDMAYDISAIEVLPSLENFQEGLRRIQEGNIDIRNVMQAYYSLALNLYNQEDDLIKKQEQKNELLDKQAETMEAISELQTDIADTSNIEGLQSKIAKSFSNIPVKFDYSVEDQKVYLEYVEAEYQLHLNRIKEMELANKEETDEVIKEETAQRLEEMKAELEAERIDAIKEYLFGTDAYELEADKIKQSVENIFSEGIGEEQQTQIQSLIDKEQERLELLKAQIGLLQKQYGEDLQEKLQQVIELEEERAIRIAEANSEAEKSIINQEYNTKKDVIDKEIEVIRQRQAYAENQIKIEEDLIAYLNSSIGKMKDQRVAQEKLAKDLEKQRQEEEKRQEEQRKKDDEERKKEQEQKDKDAEEERKRQEELAKEREKRNKQALDYLKKQETSQFDVINKIEQAHDEWRAVWGETLDDAMMLDADVRAALEAAHDKFNREIVTDYIKEVEDAFKKINIDSVDSIDNAFKMLEEAEKTAEAIKEKIGDEIPQSLINQLDNMSNKIWANLYDKLKKSLDKITKDLFSKYGGERYRDIRLQVKISEIETEIGEDFSVVLATADKLLKDTFNPKYVKEALEYFKNEISEAYKELGFEIEGLQKEISDLESTQNSQYSQYETYISQEKAYTKALEEKSKLEKQLSEDEKMLIKNKENLIQLDKDLLNLKQKGKSYEDVENSVYEVLLSNKITDKRKRITKSQLDEILKTITDDDIKKLIQANYDAGEDTWEKLLKYIQFNKDEIAKSIETTTKNLEEWTPATIKELEDRIASAKSKLKEIVVPEKPSQKPAGLEDYLEKKRKGELKDSDELIAKKNRLNDLLTEQKGLNDNIDKLANERLETERQKIRDTQKSLEILKQEAIEIGKINVKYEDRLSLLQKQFQLELDKMRLGGASELDILDKQIEQQRILMAYANQRKDDEEEIVGVGNASVETYQALADAELGLQDLLKQRGQILQQQFLDVISQVQEFADMLNQAFEDGVITAGELLDMLTETMVQLGSKLADTFAPGTGQIVQAVAGLVGTMQSIFGSIFQEITGGNEVYKNLNQQKELHDQINSLLEARNKLMEAMIKMGNKELDTLSEQIDYLKESIDLLLQKLGLEGQSAEQVLANYQSLLERYDEINQAIIALQSDIADDNFFEKIGDWFAGWAGMSKEEQLKRLQAELEALGLQIDNYEQLLELQQMIIDKEKERVKEAWDIAKIQAELSGDIAGSYDAQINYIKEMIARAEEFHLTQLEQLELEQQLNQLYEDRYDTLTEAFKKEMDLAIKKAKLQGYSEEQIQQMQLEMIDNLIAAKEYEIEQLGLTVDRETELVDLQLERLEIQKQINGELGNQGILMNEAVRSLIRQVIEARKLGDIQAEQENLIQAAQGLLAQGLSLSEINKLLGTNFNSLGEIGASNIPMMPEFNPKDFDIKNIEQEPLFSEMIKLNTTAETQVDLLVQQNQILMAILNQSNKGIRTSITTGKLTASSFERLLKEKDRVIFN